MKLLLDMNLPPRLADKFSAKGVEARHWSQLGAPDAADAEIMRFAADADYIVLTFDLDFSAILAATKGSGPSVVQIRALDLTSETVFDFILSALRQVERELKDGAILTVDTRRARIRLLPLGER